jgi:ribosomal protein S18 acetylase RimI-like enzyme
VSSICYVSMEVVLMRKCSAHVSAITVSPGHRRLGLASMMMDLLERVGERERTWLYALSSLLLSDPELNE